MVAWLLCLAAGLITGVVSGCGIGGGTLLMLVLTEIAHMEPPMAAVINLLYFIGCALPAVRAHSQNGLIRGDIVAKALPVGIPAAVLGAWIASLLDTSSLRRLFGVLLLLIAARDLLSFWKKRK